MDSKEKKIQMLRDGKISNVLIKLGIPIMIGMIVSALYNVVDAYFVGGLGISQMAAVSVVFMNNIITSEGTTKISMTAMLLGAGLNIILCPIFTTGWRKYCGQCFC